MVFLQKHPSQSWKQMDMIARTDSTKRTQVVSNHLVVLQWIASCCSCLALKICVHSWWSSGIHYQGATNRECIEWLIQQLCARSDRRRTQHLPRLSAQKLRLLIMLLFLCISPLWWRVRCLGLKGLTQIF
jgi:hypothetical protein